MCVYVCVCVCVCFYARACVCVCANMWLSVWPLTDDAISWWSSPSATGVHVVAGFLAHILLILLIFAGDLLVWAFWRQYLLLLASQYHVFRVLAHVALTRGSGSPGVQPQYHMFWVLAHVALTRLRLTRCPATVPYV